MALSATTTQLGTEEALVEMDEMPIKRRWRLTPGLVFSLPYMAVFMLCFLAPLMIVLLFSFMPAKSYSLLHLPTLNNFIKICSGTYYISILWSVALATATVIILLLICYPLAFAIVKKFGRFSMFITMAVTVSLIISENIRLYGWVLTLMKRGVADGLFDAMGWGGFDGFLYNVPVIVFGMVYVYLPFMLFPLTLGISMIPKEVREAATDMGASRLDLFRYIDLPLSMSGIVTGSMLTFIFSLGAMAEAKVLGGDKITTITDEIESAFTYGQDWAFGSALSMVLILLAGVIVFVTFKWMDPEALMGQRK